MSLQSVPSGYSSSVRTFTFAKSSRTAGVVTVVPHVRTPTLPDTTRCTFRYNPAPGYQRELSGSFSKRTANTLSFAFTASVTSK